MSRINRLQHDSAYAIATHVLTVFENLLRDEEKRDAFCEVYDAAMAWLEAYELLADRLSRRTYEAGRN